MRIKWLTEGSPNQGFQALFRNEVIPGRVSCASEAGRGSSNSGNLAVGAESFCPGADLSKQGSSAVCSHAGPQDPQVMSLDQRQRSPFTPSLDRESVHPFTETELTPWQDKCGMLRSK